MREQLEKLVTAGKLRRSNLEGLVQLAENGFCLHRNWGVGKILSIDTVFARIIIDFKDHKGHSMDLNFAVNVLKPISRDHILAQKLTNVDNLKQLAATNHLELVKLVLKSLGNKATVAQIQHILVPDIIPDDWKKWWETVKMEIKNDGHFILPRKLTDPLIYTESTVSIQDLLMKDFFSARGLKARIQIASEILKSLNEFQDKEGVVLKVVEKLNSEIANYKNTQPGVAVDAIFVRDDLLCAVNLQPEQGSMTVDDVWSGLPDLAKVLEQMPTTKHRRLLQTFRAFYPDKWQKMILETINNVSFKIVPELAHLLMNEQDIEAFKDYLSRLINQHAASSDLLYWIAKEWSEKKLDVFADIVGPELLRAILAAIERDILNEKKSSHLVDVLSNDVDFVLDLLSSAELDVIKDIARSIQMFSGFSSDFDKRALLGRIVKAYPSTQYVLSRDSSQKKEVLFVSWESLENKKKEYDELVQKKIPQNSRDIAHARSYGDLSENHEYKAAKEMQKLLMQQKYDLERQLAIAQGTDFSNPNTEVVSIGTKVELTNLSTMQKETFILLGAWDFDEQKGIISYLSPLAKVMTGKKVGETFRCGKEPEVKIYRIESIKPAIEECNVYSGNKSEETAELSTDSVKQDEQAIDTANLAKSNVSANENNALEQNEAMISQISKIPESDVQSPSETTIHKQ